MPIFDTNIKISLIIRNDIKRNSKKFEVNIFRNAFQKKVENHWKFSDFTAEKKVSNFRNICLGGDVGDSN